MWMRIQYLLLESYLCVWEEAGWGLKKNNPLIQY